MRGTARAINEQTVTVELSADGVTGRARPWAGDRSMAHLIVPEPDEVPSRSVLRRWVEQLDGHGYSSVRTGAVSARAAQQLERVGFCVAQQLTLLMLDPACWAARGPTRTAHLGRRSFADAAAVDHAAFPPGWAMDEAMIHETCHATPVRRQRGIWRDATGDALAGYAITGRSGRHGFVQRLAVHPVAQRKGVGRRLVDDAVRWLLRWHATKVYVNTQSDNTPALNLYAGAGFVPLPEGLRVMELTWR